MQLKQTLLGHGPKLTPPQLSQGGLGGGVQGEDPQLGLEGDCVAGVSEVGGADGSVGVGH